MSTLAPLRLSVAIPVKNGQMPQRGSLINKIYVVCPILFVTAGFLVSSLTQSPNAFAASTIAIIEPVQACILPSATTPFILARSQISYCLGWQDKIENTLCHGEYTPIDIQPLSDPDEIRLEADQVSFYREGRSTLSGNVLVQQTNRIVNAQTAYVYRDNKSNQVTKIELFNHVRYLEPDRLLVARKVTLHPEEKTGTAEDVIYRLNSLRRNAVLPSWGQASWVERFADQHLLLQKATYTTCAPKDDAWHLSANKITIDQTTDTGVARDAKLYLGKIPILYSPYLTFPTSKARKSGFLIPTVGHTSQGGFDFTIPYYWNIAPNYDATITPHVYSRRGVMIGGQFRYLTRRSSGTFVGRFLPDDHAYSKFLNSFSEQYPELKGASTDRWSVGLNHFTQITPNLDFHVNYQQVSDDYFLEDFSTNLAILTERQLLREGQLNYHTEHWLFRGMVQSYQTLQPINQTPVSDIYQRLPQLYAYGNYDELPLNAHFTLSGQVDNFRWANSLLRKPEGPRYYLNPILTFPQMASWGYFTPGLELVQNYYDMNSNLYFADATAEPSAVLYAYNDRFFLRNFFGSTGYHFENTILRYRLDGGLFFDRDLNFFGNALIQTLEPRLNYLLVPYRNQNIVPVFDSAYTIFSIDELFRTNRFSGYDRIGDTNQLSYALTTRLLSEEDGDEKASLTVGQIKYFKHRRVQLCQSTTGDCEDDPLTLGFLSATYGASPIASRLVYHFNPLWSAIGDYMWNPATSGTNNGHLNLHYQRFDNRIINLGYSYLVDGDITQVANTNITNNPLNQVSVGASWPLTEKWSVLGAYNYNISKRYEMLSFLGFQYDSCCWAVRLLADRAFKSLDSLARPQYSNSIHLQLLLKGLGSVGISDPATTIYTFIPGYHDQFHS